MATNPAPISLFPYETPGHPRGIFAIVPDNALTNRMTLFSISLSVQEIFSQTIFKSLGILGIIELKN